MNAQQAVLMTNYVSRVDGEVACICPHCKRPAFLATPLLNEVRGEIFKHSDGIDLRTQARCDGVFEVSSAAEYDRFLFSAA